MPIGQLAAVLLVGVLAFGGKAFADDPHHLDARIVVNPREARSRCLPAFVSIGEACKVDEFGGIGMVAGRKFFYARYNFTPPPETDFTPLPYPRVVIFKRLTSAMLRPIIISGDDAAFFYQKPKILQSGSRTLLRIPATENGSGNFNREMLYVWKKGGWRDVDATSWLNDLAHRLPRGLAIKQGVYPDYTRMTAATPLWQDIDGPRCGTGGRADISLQWRGDRIAVRGVRIKKAGECGETIRRGKVRPDAGRAAHSSAAAGEREPATACRARARDLPLLRAPKGTILVQLRAGTWGMSAKMNRTAACIAAACLAIVASPVAAAPDAASARAFVEKLYSHYPSTPEGIHFNPTGKNANEVFDPGMVAAFREDTRLANGEVGFIDSDPLCQCQDDSGLKANVVGVTMTSPNAADAVVNLQYPSEKLTLVLTLHLVPVNGAWRIHDLSMGDMKSYRADLLKANKEAAAEPH